MLKISKVSKKFGDIVALEDISFDVDAGEFVFITGPSGSGKTTLIRMILREILPDTGEILLDDKDITKLKNKDVPKLRQQIGVVFQDFKVLPERTVRENVDVALAVIGLKKDEWKRRVDNVLDLVGLTKRSKLFPSQLSGGELQRVSLARALVVNPKILLADEPTGNLDWDTADKMMELFERINQEGKTVIMATHHEIIVDKLKKRSVELAPPQLKPKDDGDTEVESTSEKEDKTDEKAKKKSAKRVKVKVEEI
jgi:cell division transport system ATP-binding protein